MKTMLKILFWLVFGFLFIGPSTVISQIPDYITAGSDNFNRTNESPVGTYWATPANNSGSGTVDLVSNTIQANSTTVGTGCNTGFNTLITPAGRDVIVQFKWAQLSGNTNCNNTDVRLILMSSTLDASTENYGLTLRKADTCAQTILHKQSSWSAQTAELGIVSSGLNVAGDVWTVQVHLADSTFIIFKNAVALDTIKSQSYFPTSWYVGFRIFYRGTTLNLLDDFVVGYVGTPGVDTVAPTISNIVMEQSAHQAGDVGSITASVRDAPFTINYVKLVQDSTTTLDSIGSIGTTTYSYFGEDFNIGAIGSHTVNIVAADDSGNITWSPPTTYTVAAFVNPAPVVGALFHYAGTTYNGSVDTSMASVYLGCRTTLTRGHIDTVWFDSGNGSTWTNIKQQLVASSADTTVYTTPIKYAATGTYYYRVRAVSDSLQRDTSTTYALTVYPTSQASGNFWVTAYLPLFANHSPDASKIDWDALTHLIIFTTEPTQTSPYYFRELPGAADSGYFDGAYEHITNWNSDLVDSAKANGVKVLMCLGGEVGGNATNFSYMIADAARRTAYINYVVAFAARRDYDGFDIDHEFTAQAEGTNLRAFIRELYITSGHKIITTAVPVWEENAYHDNAAFYNSDTVAQINIMMYRQADGSSVVGYNSPLRQPLSTYSNYNGGCWFGQSPANPANPYGQGPYDAWANMGINKSKIGCILPFEMAYISGNSAPGQTRNGWVQYANYSSVLSAIAAYPQGVHWDDVAKVPWFGNPNTNEFYSYENEASYRAKIDTLMKAGFGGIGIWELYRGYATNATPDDELLQIVKSIVQLPTEPGYPPAKPTHLTPASGSSVNKGSVTLDWSTVTDATSYNVRVMTTTDSTVVTLSTGTASTYSVPSGLLQYSTTYRWQVSASNAYGSSGYTTYWTFTTLDQPVTPPSTPTQVNPANNATDITSPVTFRWTSVDSATSYRLQVKADTTSATSLLDENYTDTTQTASLSLVASTSYWWRILSTNTSGSSAWSYFWKFTNAAPIAPDTMGVYKYFVMKPSGRAGFTTELMTMQKRTSAPATNVLWLGQNMVIVLDNGDQYICITGSYPVKK